MVDELIDAISDVRLVGWFLRGVPDIDSLSLERVSKHARRANALIVVMDVQPALLRRLLYHKLPNILITGYQSGQAESSSLRV